MGAVQGPCCKSSISLVSCLTSHEHTSVCLPNRFPFYFELKIAFVIWLLSPYTKGSSVLYRKFVHPTLSNKEKVCPFLQLFLAWPSKDIPTPPATDISYGWPEPAVTWQSLAPGGRHCLCTVVSTGNLPAASPLRSLIPLGDRRIHHTSSRQEL